MQIKREFYLQIEYNPNSGNGMDSGNLAKRLEDLSITDLGLILPTKKGPCGG